MITLDTEIDKIKGVGKAISKRLNNIDIKTINDLLFYFPYKYDDLRKITPINELEIGSRANIIGQVELIQNKRSPRRRMYITETLVSDGTEQVKVIWFNQPFIGRNLKIGDKISLVGKIEEDYSGPFMVSPIYEKITGGKPVHTQGIIPNYHLSSNLTQKQIRFLIKQVIASAGTIKEWLPEETIRRQKLLKLNEAIKSIHFPKTETEIEKARKRLAFDELFLVQLRSQKIKRELESLKAVKINFFEEETKKFVKSLPFKLTDAQRKTAWEILRSLNNDQPMFRLLEGDVGSGKTIVAVIAMYNVYLNKKKSVLMAPTEILAKQHYDTLCNFFENHNIKIGLITRNQKIISDKEGTDSSQIINDSDIIIGTHSLIQKNIDLNNVALLVIDEQHRFGVEQRKILTQKSSENKILPHLLSMTATPIPRSLALALYGDLDISIINQMPSGRKKISTHIIPENKRQDAYKFIKEQVAEGRQVFVICPIIDISDKLGVKSVKEEYKKLNELIFKDLKIEMLHGKMKPAEKEKIMQDFLGNKINILVSTSVVEVGVDIPNATIMMIEGADRFGLAQLHQFRGRVGRSNHQSFCFLFTDNQSSKTMQRLQALTKYHDGFALSKIDLKFRGPGEVYGTIQKGFPELKIASLFDYALIKEAKEEVEELLKKDKNLINCPKVKEKTNSLNQLIHME